LENVHKNLHEDLVEKCKQGNQAAHKELYDLYCGAMFNICYRMANDRDDAQDILQDAFISAFKNIESYRGTASFGAWLKKIVVNKAINHIKRKRLEFVPVEEMSVEVAEEDVYEDEEIYLNVEMVKGAIQQLPNGYRVVFSLYLLEGYDHKEIGEILGITESTSKSQYNRAKKKLREILKSKYEYER